MCKQPPFIFNNKQHFSKNYLFLLVIGRIGHYGYYSYSFLLSFHTMFLQQFCFTCLTLVIMFFIPVH